jgi:hypothetical protein
MRGDLVSGLTDAELAHAAVLVDDMLLKAAGADYEARFMAMELRLFRRAARVFIEHAEAAADAATSGLSGDAPADGAEVERISRRIAAEFRGWERAVASDIKAVMEEAYKLSKRQMAARISGRLDSIQPAGSPHLTAEMIKANGDDDEAEIIPSFDLVDRQAVDAMSRRQVIWIGDHYDQNLEARVKELVRINMIESGAGRRDAGKLLREALRREFGVDDGDRATISLPPGWAGPTAQYFEGLAANTVTQARVRGAVQQMIEVQVSHYEIVNPLDERTCKRCRYMDGKTFEMRHAADMIGALDDATHPEDVRAIHPWPKDEAMLKAADAEGKLGMLFPLPPYHFRCRCGVDMSEDAEIAFEPVPAPEPKPEPKPRKPRAPRAPKPAPAPAPPSEADILRDGAVLERRALGGGVNATEVVTVQHGPYIEDAVWKPVGGEAQGLRSNIPHGTYYKREAAASEIADQLGVRDLLPRTVARKIDGQSGSIQMWAREAQPSFSGDLDHEAVERMRVFDFIVGNTDRHDGNVLWQRGPKGARPVMIDHGLCFPKGRPDRFIQPWDTTQSQRKLAKSTIKLIQGIDGEKLAKTLLDNDIEPEAVRHTLYRLSRLQNNPRIVEFGWRGSTTIDMEYAARGAPRGLPEDERKRIDDLVERLAK